MTTLEVSDELARAIRREAEARGLPLEEFLRSAIRRERTIADRRALEREQAWWQSLSPNERSRYQGETVAIYGHQVIDHDRDDLALYRRVRSQFGHTPVLIMAAEGPRDIIIHSPHLTSE